MRSAHAHHNEISATLPNVESIHAQTTIFSQRNHFEETVVDVQTKQATVWFHNTDLSNVYGEKGHPVCVV
jgi:hypothetical protein